MLTLGQPLIGRKILSLRTGGELGELTKAIINPNNLKLEGWFVNDKFHKRTSILLSKEIREIILEGFLVNDHSAMSDPGELIRIKELLDLHFELIGKPVVTKRRARLGKVNDYAFNKESFLIQKLYTAQSMIKSLGTSGNIIDRSQIVEISHKNIVVEDATASDAQKSSTLAALPAQP